MSASTSPVTTLGPGTVVGGRFTVERTATEDSMGVVLAARDSKTGRAIALRVLAPHLLPTPEAQKALRAQCRLAATLSHRNIVATYGVGTDPQGAYFIACEWIDGRPLSQVSAERRAEGRPLSLRGAYNVIAHICKGLSHAHPKTCHGALRPSVVWVSRSGRVKVGDFGVGRAVVGTVGAGALGPDEQPALAPEVKAGGQPTVASDLFGLGAILYELLTGLSPAQGFVAPSQAHPEANAMVDEVLLRCLAPDPSQRFESPDEVRRALLSLVADTAEPPEEDLGIEVDLELASSRPPPKESGRAQVTVPRGGPALSPGGPPAPVFEPPPSPGMPPAGATAAAPEAGPSAGGGEAVEVDLAAILAKITANDAPRWMVVKDNLDHGPFSGRELVDLILKGEMQEGHTLLNMDTGERRPMREWEEFTDFLEAHKIRKQEEAHKAALARTEKVERRSNAAKILIAAGVGGLLVVSGVGFVLSRQAAGKEELADTDLADLYERGDIKIEGSAGILPDPGRRRGPRGRRGGGRRGGGSMTYEEAMNQAVEMDLNAAGGEQRLSPQTVAGTMNRHINKFFGCVGAELRKGGSLSKVQIDLAIAGSGKVLGATVRQGSSSFKSCVSAKARQVKFPSFSAPRMGARYNFSVD